MKGMFKRALAGVAAAALAATGLALGAGAANAQVVETANITLTGTDMADTRVFNAYKLGDYTDVEYTQVDGLTSVGINTDTDWKTELKNAIIFAGQQNAYTTSVYNGNPAAYVASLDTTANGAALRDIASSLAGAAAQKIADYGRLSAVNNTVTVPVTDDGLYLVTDNDGSPIIIGSPVQVAEGQYENEIVATDAKKKLGEGVLKPNSGPSTDKHVTGADVDPVITFDGQSVYVGQTLTYTVSTTVPNTTGYSESNPYQLIIKDTADAGLTIGGIQSVTVGDDTLDVDVDYTVGSGDIEGKTVTTVTITNVAGKDGQNVVVTYTATVNNAVLDGMINNEAVAGHDSDHFGQPGKVTVKTHGFEFTKQDSNGNALKDAGFVISKDGDYLKQDPTTKVWTVAKNIDDATVFLSDPDGKVQVQGLSFDTYTVEETVVPDGFMSSITPEFAVTINDDGSFTLGNDVWGLVDTTNKVVKNVENVSQLPLTGAAGTVLFTVLGVLIAGAGALVYMKSRNVKHALRG